MISKRLVFALACLAVGCGGADDESAPNPYVEGFHPAAAKPGYTRFITPPVEALQPGEENMWCQWVAKPFAEETDVLSVVGEQSVGGHHAILYATTAAAPVGTNRLCTDEDLTSVRYLGGIGGEGVTGDANALPAGVVYRIPAGLALMANVHYINYTDQPIDGQAVLDLELVPPRADRVVATLYTNIDVDIALPPHAPSSMDVSCVMQEEYRFFWFGNHMHSIGVSAFTEVIRADGTKEMVREDTTWSPEMRFNPAFNRWPVEAPFVVKKGDTLHTQCHWQNAGPSSVVFPSEMCVGFGFAVGSGLQINCIKGQWTQ